MALPDLLVRLRLPGVPQVWIGSCMNLLGSPFSTLVDPPILQRSLTVPVLLGPTC